MGNKGWECPRCGKVWAPWVECCDCRKQTIPDHISGRDNYYNHYISVEYKTRQ